MESQDNLDFDRLLGEIIEAITAWDGYISGRNVELIPGERIVQTWRTSEFGVSDPDSNLEDAFLYFVRKGSVK